MSPVVVLAVGLLCTALIVGCGGDSGSGDDGGPPLDAVASRGREVAEDRGCVSCHSTDGGSSAGPSWGGLWGSTVELDDGSTVVADASYVERSIHEPDAQVVDGYAPIMPTVELSDADVDAVVAYVQALG